MSYYLYDGQKTIGPFEPGELSKRPHFSGSTLVCPVGATSADAWKPAASFPDLAKAITEVSLPPPPPPPPGAGLALTLPGEPTPAQVTAAAPPPALDPSLPVLTPPSEKLLLIVEDNELVRTLLEAATTGQGFKVVCAANGLEASEKLAAQMPDLIITDLMMPGQGGYEFLRSLQASGAPRVPVFIVTGSNLNESTIGMIRQEANVVEFVEKPVKINTFVAALHEHLGTRPPPRRANHF